LLTAAFKPKNKKSNFVKSVKKNENVKLIAKSGFQQTILNKIQNPNAHAQSNVHMLYCNSSQILAKFMFVKQKKVKRDWTLTLQFFLQLHNCMII
jgi:ABC-type nitrate/sulfonate/bicarbonate transport system ATPase subunit